MNDFSVLHIPLAEGSPFCRETLCKVHRHPQGKKRSASESVLDNFPPDRTIFMTHLDKFVGEDEIRRYYNCTAGPVDSVTLKRVKKKAKVSRRSNNSKKEKTSAVTDQTRPDSSASAASITTLCHVVFFNKTSASRAVAGVANTCSSPTVPLLLRDGPDSHQSPTNCLPLPVSPGGLKEMINQCLREYRDPNELQKEVDDFMEKFDADKDAEKTAQRAEAEAAAAGEGFTLISSRGGRTLDGTVVRGFKASNIHSRGVDTSEMQSTSTLKHIAKNNAKKKKHKPRAQSVSDFYKFQLRHKKRDELAKVRSQRKEEARTVAEMRISGVFNKIAVGPNV